MLTETNPPFTEMADQYRRIQLSGLLHDNRQPTATYSTANEE